MEIFVKAQNLLGANIIRPQGSWHFSPETGW